MKKLALILLSVIFVFVTSFSFNYGIRSIKSVNKNNNVCSKYTVVIDAGHGGKDSGTSAKDGTREKDINLSIARALYDYLMVCGVNTVMTRYDDYEVYKENEQRTRSDLYNRLDFINSIDNAIMVSIHQNFFTNESEWGMQIWYSPNDEYSKMIADNILNINSSLLSNTNGRTNRKSTDDYYILYKATCPSVMVECGFMSNVKENEKLKALDYQKSLAYAIMLGLNEYIGS